MLSVKEVDKLVGNCLLETRIEKIPLTQAVGRILKQEVVADRDFPPFDRVTMDGIAINFGPWQRGEKGFKVEGLSAAGTEKMNLKDSAACLEVMTGAVMPANTDTIVKYEDVTIKDGHAQINNDVELQEGQHIHKRGSDRRRYEVLMTADRIITAAEVAVLATVGVAEVEVAKKLTIAVVATGDELVAVDEIPMNHQIRKSNVYALTTALRKHEFDAEIFHLKDDKEQLREGLDKILRKHDVVVLSGGVSKGKLDFVPEILKELGIEKQFHFVKQRPGKPFWFGRYKTGVVFALPGNPVSTFVGMFRYVLPFLYRSAGVELKVVKAVLDKDFNFKPDLTYFLQVKLSYSDKGELLATPAPGQGSGDLANLVEADAFIELPNDITEFKKGEVFRCYSYR